MERRAIERNRKEKIAREEMISKRNQRRHSAETPNTRGCVRKKTRGSMRRHSFLFRTPCQPVYIQLLTLFARGVLLLSFAVLSSSSLHPLRQSGEEEGGKGW